MSNRSYAAKRALFVAADKAGVPAGAAKRLIEALAEELSATLSFPTTVKYITQLLAEINKEGT